MSESKRHSMARYRPMMQAQTVGAPCLTLLETVSLIPMPLSLSPVPLPLSPVPLSWSPAPLSLIPVSLSWIQVSLPSHPATQSLIPSSLSQVTCALTFPPGLFPEQIDHPTGCSRRRHC